MLNDSFVLVRMKVTSILIFTALILFLTTLKLIIALVTLGITFV